ncbi:MAG: hypothetical protein II644_04730 [Paludibacteraceae bacterium]|nr:hypothetical protein [Paludibacteraceae bacterium]
MRNLQLSWFACVLCALLGLSACEGSSFRNSVPAYPVRVVVDTRSGAFVHFQPTNLNANVVVNRNGYFLNGEYVLPLGATDMYGYGGVVLFVSLYGYDAYDLACPYCALHGQKQSCTIDGFYAECDKCGEKYDLGSGYALPTQGLSHEALRRLNIINSDGKLTVTQQ